LPEDVTDGESVLFVEPGDAPALATGLGRLLLDAELRSQIARGARKRYQERFSADAFAADLRRIYTDLGFPSASHDGARTTID
jgi:glycosyltransferase involved in cell wall biosynthesis